MSAPMKHNAFLAVSQVSTLPEFRTAAIGAPTFPELLHLTPLIANTAHIHNKARSTPHGHIFQ